MKTISKKYCNAIRTYDTKVLDGLRVKNIHKKDGQPILNDVISYSMSCCYENERPIRYLLEKIVPEYADPQRVAQGALKFMPTKKNISLPCFVDEGIDEIICRCMVYKLMGHNIGILEMIATDAQSLSKKALNAFTRLYFRHVPINKKSLAVAQYSICSKTSSN